MHSLLRRQLRRCGLGGGDFPPEPGQWRAFLEAVDAAYHGHDQDRYTLERSLDISSREMHELYSELEQRSEGQLSRERDRLDTIVGNIGDGVCLLSHAGRIEFHNPAAEQLLGYAADGTMNGQDFSRHLAPEERGKVEVFVAATDPRSPLRVNVAQVIRTDDSTLPVSYVISPIVHRGKSIGSVLLFRDMTGHFRMIEELEQAKSAAEEANRAKSEFLSHMSHELRTPLNAILGFTQLLQRDQSLHPEQKDNAAEVVRAGRHLLKLIDEILDLARIERGRLALSPEGLDLQEVLDECGLMFAPLAEDGGIDLAIPHRAGLVVRADRTRLKQVLFNLLSNAIKYSRKNDKVTVSCAKGAGGSVRISVSDTGPGIPPQLQRHLFHPFNRLGAEATSVEGTGLGLNIARRLVEAMGGRMDFASAPGEGTTFSVELPRAQSPSTAGHPADVGTAVAQQSPAPGKGSVLCIEDNQASLRLFAQIIKSHTPYQFLGASSPGEGLDLARSYGPDLILLDINLPDMDGFEVLRQLRARVETRDIPVIAVSANAMHSDIENGASAGFLDYLTKPIEVVRLVTSINAALAAGE